jgi:hypothetical protein
VWSERGDSVEASRQKAALFNLPGNRGGPQTAPCGDAIQVCFTPELFPLLARPDNEMKKKLKWIAGSIAAVFVLLQFTNPARTNPPAPPGGDISATNPPPPQIAALLHAACYDCHSDETKWPWYGHVAPVSWLVVGDVNDGRERLNFSDWPHALPERAAKRLEQMSEELDYKEMPPKKYTLIHAGARLTDSQRQELIHWADQEAEKLKAAGANP